MSGGDDGILRAASRLDRLGDDRHELTLSDSRKGGVAPSGNGTPGARVEG
jgi:hypothetical protein